MSNFAILRTEKLKAPANVAGSASHIERTRPTKNADPEKAHLNRWLIGGPGMYAESRKVWDSLSKKPRSTAVHGFEVLMTASPEAFHERNLNVEEFSRLAIAWAKEEFAGATIIGACLHLDEKTPHIQMIVVPTERKPDGTLSLNCRKYLGDKEKLSEMQTRFADALAPLGLDRGIKGSKATHTKISQFYGAITSKDQVKLKRPVVGVPPLILSSKGRAAWSAAQTEKIIDGLSDLSKLRAQAKAGIIHERQADQLKAANGALSKENQDLKRQAKEQAARLRSLPLEKVAEALGCHKVERDRWESPAGKLSITGAKFFNHETEAGGGGAFDLVMHVNDCDYKTALIWLRDQYDPTAAVAAAVEAARIKAEAEVEKAPPRPFQAPQNVETKWPRVREYLTTVRGLAGALVDKLKEQGWLGADSRANAFFIKMAGNKAVAAELRGTGRSDFKGSALGSSSKDGVFVVNGGKQRLAVCESAIDAISYVQLHPDATAISTGGTGKWRAALPFLEKHREQYQEVVCAADNGEGGEGMALNLNLHHDAPRNGFKDWNDALKAVQIDPAALDVREPEPVAEPRSKERKAQPRKRHDDTPSLG